MDWNNDVMDTVLLKGDRKAESEEEIWEEEVNATPSSSAAAQGACFISFCH